MGIIVGSKNKLWPTVLGFFTAVFNMPTSRNMMKHIWLAEWVGTYWMTNFLSDCSPSALCIPSWLLVIRFCTSSNAYNDWGINAPFVIALLYEATTHNRCQTLTDIGGKASSTIWNNQKCCPYTVYNDIGVFNVFLNLHLFPLHLDL